MGKFQALLLDIKDDFKLAVLIEGISVVIRVKALLNKFPGGWESFKKIVPNQTLCADNEIVRVGFMSPEDVESFIKKLEQNGLVFLGKGEAIDIAVADQMRGLSSKCDWLEFGHINIGGKQRKLRLDSTPFACR